MLDVDTHTLVIDLIDPGRTKYKTRVLYLVNPSPKLCGGKGERGIVKREKRPYPTIDSDLAVCPSYKNVLR